MLEKIQAYVPYNEQEQADKEEILRRLQQGGDLYTREDPSAHMTASAWVVSPDRRQVLLCYHNLYDSWSWLGGHCDGERDLLHTAIREVREESGLKELRPVSEEIYSLEILCVDGHRKKGKYLPSHLHLNLTFLLEADPTQPLRSKPDENKAVRWFPAEEAVQASSEEWMRKRVYQKLMNKLSLYRPESCKENENYQIKEDQYVSDSD